MASKLGHHEKSDIFTYSPVYGGRTFVTILGSPDGRTKISWYIPAASFPCGHLIFLLDGHMGTLKCWSEAIISKEKSW